MGVISDQFAAKPIADMVTSGGIIGSIFEPSFVYHESLLDRCKSMQAEFAALVGISKTLSATHVVANRGSSSWVPPLVGWCKLIVNGNGTRSNSFEIASCGGVVCDEQGWWLIGFAKQINMCFVLDSESWGMYEGLFCARSIGLIDLF
ncbi:hypothetical protein V6N12_002697 [Hibiscus sabdariffa]|uniref:RNase H type-1 domain-containing protein n=1 Tax=Hibiscus sabdariffa TaxID=183260 RepID=A0ABR2EA38_9ROSI